MESIIGQLQRILIGSRNDLEAIFAKKILQNFQIGSFPRQHDLSKDLFISDSVITKICKKMGYSGFRQFNERLKIEYQRYQLDRYRTISDSKVITEMLSLSLAEANENNDFINKLRQAVLLHKEITIFPSYQAESVGFFLHDYLMNKRISTRIWNPARSFIISIPEFLGAKEPILFIFTGSDNYRNYEIYENLKDDLNHEIFIITTSGQTDNFDLTNKFILKSNLKYSNTFVREVLIEMLFLEIFE